MMSTPWSWSAESTWSSTACWCAPSASSRSGRPGEDSRALISVSDKNGLSTLATGLHKLGVELVSTAGSAAFLRDAGVPVSTVEELTGVEELLGGRVKTLHPAVHARDPRPPRGRRRHGIPGGARIPPIDMVVCNLYPFGRWPTGAA